MPYSKGLYIFWNSGCTRDANTDDAMNATAHTFLVGSDSDDDLADNINLNEGIPLQMIVQQQIVEENALLEADIHQPAEDSILPPSRFNNMANMDCHQRSTWNS